EEDRLETPADVLFAADHQAVALGESPDAAAGAGVDVVQLLPGEHLRAPLIVVKVRVAAIDDHVARRQQIRERDDGRFGWIAGGPHHPDVAWRLQGADERLERRDAAGPGGFGLADGLSAAIVRDDVVPAALEAGHHVETHLAETDEAELHERVS